MKLIKDLFTTILSMSITASYVALGIIIIRFLFKKLPKVFSYILWTPVFFRLLCPISFNSIFSVFNFININRAKATEIPIKSITPITIPAANSYSPSSAIITYPSQTNINPINILYSSFSLIWIIGVIILIIYSFISYFKIKNKLITATLIKDNIYETDKIKTAFVLGFIRPKIYIPSNIDDINLPYILEHERTHILRKDHIIKLIAYIALILHWFNPLAWICFSLMSKDMEMSCDENVLNKLGDNEKFGYSNSLLSLSTNRNTLLTANPLAFGESQVKLRIKNILSFKKPAFYIIIISIITVLSVIVVFTTNPSKQKIITEVETKKITSAINEYYLKIDPDSKEILKIYNIKRYGDNYLVLTNKYRGEGESFSILFLVDHNFNITAKASGDIPISPCFSANVIKDKNKSIIYGNFKNKKWEPKTDTLINVQIDSIKIIFENGKKIKEKVSMDKGYIIVADTLSNIKNIEVYNNKGELQSDLNESALSEYSFINDQNDNKSQMENKENSNTSFDKSKFEEYYLETVVIRDCETKEGPGEDYKTNGTLKYGDIILAAGKYQNWLLANNGQKNFWVESSNIIDEKKHIEYNLGIITAEKVMVGTVPLYKGNLVQILKRDKDMTCVTIRVIDINVGKTGWIKNSDYVPAKEGVYFNQAYLKKGTIIYKEPSLKSGQIDDYEPKQYEIFVNIEKEQNGWVLISTFGPLNGWVRKENIFIPTAEALTDDEKRAFQVVNEYFDAFSKSNYNKMCALATEKHNNTFVHSDNVWGIKWAKARQIDLIKDPSFLGIGSSESVLVFNISAYIATEKNSAQYPSKITNFYVILIKDNNGNWRVDSYTTG